MIRTGKVIMQDESTNVSQPREERAPWVEPVLSRIRAGSAEVALGPARDLSDYS